MAVDSREALIDEFVEDALDTYAEREESFGSELTREIERYVILQIVDTRWREHLESMDYLREVSTSGRWPRRTRSSSTGARAT